MHEPAMKVKSMRERKKKEKGDRKKKKNFAFAPCTSTLNFFNFIKPSTLIIVIPHDPVIATEVAIQVATPKLRVMEGSGTFPSFFLAVVPSFSSFSSLLSSFFLLLLTSSSFFLSHMEQKLWRRLAPTPLERPRRF